MKSCRVLKKMTGPHWQGKDAQPNLIELLVEYLMFLKAKKLVSRTCFCLLLFLLETLKIIHLTL